MNFLTGGGILLKFSPELFQVGLDDPSAYIFYEEDSPDNLIFNAQGKIKGATLEKLVERATFEKNFGLLPLLELA